MIINREENINRPCSPDIMLGAYLMSHLRHHCEHCGTQATPQWRKGWYSEVLGRSVLLCNACGLKYHKNQFCPYCKYVYGKEHSTKHEDGWICCRLCQRRVHTQCEFKYGGGTQFSSPNDYVCPSCRVPQYPAPIRPQPQQGIMAD